MVVEKIFRNIGLTILYFLCICLAGMMLTYIEQLRTTVEFTNEENVKLLNGMHEGLIVL